jgi:hypothetical protein
MVPEPATAFEPPTPAAAAMPMIVSVECASTPMVPSDVTTAWSPM